MTASSTPTTRRALLTDLYWAAVTAAAPGPALDAALNSLVPKLERRVHLLALGKAAHPMAVAAVQWLRARGHEPAGGLVVSPEPVEPLHPALALAVGDHPEPGLRSFGAAELLQYAARQVRPEDEAWVLLSGGTTSLIGAPVPGVSPTDLAELYQLLLGSGLAITRMNRIRKRFSRWGAGRLASALAPARVKTFTISDVIGDDLSSIGSGPCVPDDSTAAEVRSLLTSAGLWEKIPGALRGVLAAVERGEAPETPKPGDPAFENMQVHLVASNHLALEAAAARASALGLAAHLMGASLAGEARAAGEAVVERLINYRESAAQAQGKLHKHAVLIWGGETTVTLGSNPGQGGRSQELALAAARILAQAGPAAVGTALLAAGTDGRDGPTDAAGAIVDSETWLEITHRGRNPERDLAGHDAYAALEAAGALLRTGLTGTNVMDVVIGLVENQD